MDISKTSPVQPLAPEASATDTRTSLSRVLNMIVGHTESAQITEVENISTEDKNLLQEQTRAAIVALIKQIKAANGNLALPETEQLSEKAIEKLAIPPAIKAALVKLIQQRELLNSPQLVIIKLQTPQKSFVVFTNQPLQTGQQINLQLTNPNRLSFTLPATGSAIDLQHVDAGAKSASPLANNLSPVLQTSSVSTSQLAQPPEGKINASGYPSQQIPLQENQKSPQQGLIATSASLVNNLSPVASPSQNLKTSLSLPLLSPTITTAGIAYEEAAFANKVGLTEKIGNTSASKFSISPAMKPSANPLGNASAIYERLSNLPNLVGAKHTTFEADAALTQVKESLASKLPFVELPNALLTQLHRLLDLPAEVRKPILSASLEQTLRRLAERIRSPVELSQAKTLEKAFKQSGLFFENQIWKSSLATHTKNTTPELPRDFKESILRAFVSTLPPAAGTTAVLPSGASLSLAVAAALNRFVNQLQNANVAAGDQEYDLESLINQLATKGSKPSETAAVKQLLNNLIQQHLAQTLTRLQTHQLQSYSQSHEANPEKAQIQYQFDIPVRHHGEVQYMHCKLHQDWVDENQKQKEKSPAESGKVKRWSVTLRFDLPTLGEFAAELKVVKEEVSAVLWANRAATHTKANELLEGLRMQLENEGVKVRQLLCLKGLPKEQQSSLGYSLIDVST